MKIFLAILFLLVGNYTIGLAQKNTAANREVVPAFRLLLTSNTYYQTKDVPKNKPLLIVYFAPDCDHCTVLMDKIFKKIHQFDKVSILLASFKPPYEVIAFAKKYQTAKYPNIKVGTEGTSYVLRDYYKLEKTPFTAVYDKHGKLAFSYKEETPVEELIKKLKKLS